MLQVLPLAGAVFRPGKAVGSGCIAFSQKGEKVQKFKSREEVGKGWGKAPLSK